jgi:hypothetical protein
MRRDYYLVPMIPIVVMTLFICGILFSSAHAGLEYAFLKSGGLDGSCRFLIYLLS